jgi:excinuclease UvrABC helicase subunit UvrB/predicted kinase
LKETLIYPAKHFVVPEGLMEDALEKIEKEMRVQAKHLREQKQLLAAERLERRTKQDLEMMREIGYCNGIENYSVYLTDRHTGETPYTLMDYFGKDYLLVIDESHVTVPQLGAMYNGDRARKKSLIENGFRLPSAYDNRPLKFSEFAEKIKQVIFTSATPGKYELSKSKIQKSGNKILIVSGPWGSGKTTVSKIIERELDFVRINNDDIYKQFFPKICNEMWLHPKEIDEAERIMVEKIKDSVEKGRNVVADYSGGWRLLKYKKEFKADVIIKNLFPKKEVIFERYRNREERNEGSLQEIETAMKKQKALEKEIGAKNFIDTSNETPEETFIKHFSFLKEELCVVEQVIRPTGLVDPELVIRSAKGQVKDVLSEIEKVVAKKERVLITTLTKKQAEDLADFLQENKIKTEYLHSDVETLDRIRILEKLRRGEMDVLVGVNLLREGLDLPEVSLVAILDADKEGFLRSETSLIQTIGRAARNVSGRVILYADQITGSMQRAIEETNRRRKIQTAYNKKHHITPQTIQKKIQSIVDHELKPEIPREFVDLENLENLQAYIKQKEKEMKDAARGLEFERAAIIRDEISQLRKMQRK